MTANGMTRDYVLSSRYTIFNDFGDDLVEYVRFHRFFIGGDDVYFMALFINFVDLGCSKWGNVSFLLYMRQVRPSVQVSVIYVFTFFVPLFFVIFFFNDHVLCRFGWHSVLYDFRGSRVTQSGQFRSTKRPHFRFVAIVSRRVNLDGDHGVLQYQLVAVQFLADVRRGKGFTVISCCVFHGVVRQVGNYSCLGAILEGTYFTTFAYSTSGWGGHYHEWGAYRFWSVGRRLLFLRGMVVPIWNPVSALSRLRTAHRPFHFHFADGGHRRPGRFHN